MLAVLIQSGFIIFSSLDVNYESNNHKKVRLQKNETEPV